VNWLNNKDKEIVLSSNESLIEIYGGSGVTKAIVQLIPWVGTFINEILSEKSNKIKEKRLETFLNALYDCIKDLDKSTLKNNWINSEEFYDLLDRAISSSLKTRSKEKIQINAFILSNVLHLKENEQNFRPEEYLAALEDLTPLEVKALLTIYQTDLLNETNKANGKEEHITYPVALQKECGLDSSEVIFMLKRLERTGFVTELTGAFIGYTGGEYITTSALKRLKEYLSLNPIVHKKLFN
jgi:DNA-binding MarR family transcriptional regulator